MSHEPLISEDLIARQSPEAQAIIRILLAKIAELEARLNKSPRNSSLPPSGEHPHAKSTPKKKHGGRPGGKLGHAKHERVLIPTDQCTAVISVRPTCCRRCGERLAGSDPAPLRHQVWDIPEIKPLITEYRRHRLTCGCGVSTCGELPPGVPHGQAGPKLIALVAMLMGCFKRSKRRVALFVEQVLNQPCSPGWVVKLQNQATAALRPAYDELVAKLPDEAVLGIDESPTKEGPVKSRLWAFVAGKFTAFAHRTTRAATVLRELLTDAFRGIVNCDRAKMYWNVGRPQWCWAHLKRGPEMRHGRC